MNHTGKPQKGQIALVSAGHLINDTYMGFIAVLLPFFVTRWEISLTEAGGLVTAFLSASYFGQPVFGWFSDRLGGRLLLAGGPLVSACFIGTLGVLPSYGWAVPWVIIAGVGAAAFHPPAAGVAHRAGGDRRALGISIFLMAGFLGVALGPIEILAVVTRFGLKSSGLTVIPGMSFPSCCSSTPISARRRKRRRTAHLNIPTWPGPGERCRDFGRLLF